MVFERTVLIFPIGKGIKEIAGSIYTNTKFTLKDNY